MVGIQGASTEYEPVFGQMWEGGKNKKKLGYEMSCQVAEVQCFCWEEVSPPIGSSYSYSKFVQILSPDIGGSTTYHMYDP